MEIYTSLILPISLKASEGQRHHYLLSLPPTTCLAQYPAHKNSEVLTKSIYSNLRWYRN